MATGGYYQQTTGMATGGYYQQTAGMATGGYYQQTAGMATGGFATGAVGGVAGVGGVGGVGGVAGGRVVAGGGVAGVGGGGIAVGGGGGAGAGTCCAATEDVAAACVCAGQAGPAAMTFVGYGEGDYITETSYKFVGAGQGNLTFVGPARNIWGRVAVLVGSLLLLAIVIVLLLPGPTTTTTTMSTTMPPPPTTQPPPPPTTKPPTTQPPPPPTTQPPPPPTTQPPPIIAECTFWGDPHLQTFDGARPSFYGDGEVWIVKSSMISIQGRFEGTKYTKGLAATNMVAVGGAFLHGHVIKVGTMESGVLTVDGNPVLPSMPSTYNLEGVATLTYNGEGKLVDGAAGIWEKHIVHMDLPMGVSVTVLRWDNYLDLRIKMPAQLGQDGACGNFNGDIADDSTEAIQMRMGARVGPGELLFGHRAAIEFTEAEQKLLKMCPSEKYTKAQQECQGELRGTHITNQNKACYLNVCYGSNEHALKYAKKMGV